MKTSKSPEVGGGGMGLLGWLILALIVLGLLGYGPCAEDCQDCGPRYNTATSK